VAVGVGVVAAAIVVDGGGPISGAGSGACVVDNTASVAGSGSSA